MAILELYFDSYLSAAMFPALLMNLTHVLRKVLQPLQAYGALSLHIQMNPIQVVGHLLLSPEHALTPFNFTADCPLIVLGMNHLHVAFHIFHCLSTNRGAVGGPMAQLCSYHANSATFWKQIVCYRVYMSHYQDCLYYKFQDDKSYL